jgi:predicted nucleic acid-binding protein
MAAVNQIVRVEVLLGCRNEAEFASNAETFAALHEVPLDSGTWERAGRLGFDLRRRGVSASVPDLIIAASAIERAATLVHADSDFDLIAQHSDLQVESYVDAV